MARRQRLIQPLFIGSGCAFVRWSLTWQEAPASSKLLVFNEREREMIDWAVATV